MLQLIINVDDPNQAGLLDSFESERIAPQSAFVINGVDVEIFHRPVIASTVATQPWQDDWTTGDFFEFAIGNPGEDNICYTSVTPVAATTGFETTLTINTVAAVAAFAATTANALTYYFSIKRTRTSGEKTEYYQRKVVLKRSVVDPDSAIPTPSPQYVLQGPIITSGLTATAGVLLGRYTASTGNIQQITVGSGLTLNSSTGVLTSSGGGDVTLAGPNVFTGATNTFDGMRIDATVGYIVPTSDVGSTGTSGYVGSTDSGVTLSLGNGTSDISLATGMLTGPWEFTGTAETPIMLLSDIAGSGSTLGSLSIATATDDAQHKFGVFGINMKASASSGHVPVDGTETSGIAYMIEKDWWDPTVAQAVIHEFYATDGNSNRPFVGGIAEPQTANVTQSGSTTVTISASSAIIWPKDSDGTVFTNMRFKFTTLGGGSSGVSTGTWYYLLTAPTNTTFTFATSPTTSGRAVTNITTGGVVTTTGAHGFSDGDSVMITGATGITASPVLDGNLYTISSASGTTFTLIGTTISVGGATSGKVTKAVAATLTAGTVATRGNYGEMGMYVPTFVSVGEPGQSGSNYGIDPDGFYPTFQLKNHVSGTFCWFNLDDRGNSGNGQNLITFNSSNSEKWRMGTNMGGSDQVFYIWDTGSTGGRTFQIHPGGDFSLGYSAAHTPASALDVDGTVTATAFSGSGASLTSIPITAITSTTSAQMRTLVSDENGTGALLFNNASAATFEGITIYDGAGLAQKVLEIPEVTVSPVNYFRMLNGATGGGVTLQSLGTDTDVDINLTTKGVGRVVLNTGLTTTGTIELGNATDTTLSRVSSGVVAIEGSNIVTAATLVGGTLPGSFTTLAASGAGSFTANGAASTPALQLSGVPFAGTGTTSFPLLYIRDANATASNTLNTAGTYFGVNGDGTQDLMNLLKDGASVLKVSSTGKLTSVAGVSAGATIETASSANIGWVSHTQIQSPTNGRLVVAYNTGGDQIASLQLGGSGHSNSYPQLYRAAGSTVVQFLQGASTSTWVDIKAAGGTFTGDVAVTGATTLTGNLTSNGALISTPQAVSTDVAANVTTLTTTFASGAGALTSTLAAGTSGQIKILSMITDGGGDVTVTVTNAFWGGAGTLVFDTAGDNVTLIYLNSKWQILVNNGVVAA